MLWRDGRFLPERVVCRIGLRKSTWCPTAGAQREFVSMNIAGPAAGAAGRPSPVQSPTLALAEFAASLRGEDLPARVVEACRGCATVYHCVAQVPLAKDRELFTSVNIGGMANLLRAARGTGVRKVIYVSSSAIFASDG